MGGGGGGGGGAAVRRCGGAAVRRCVRACGCGCGCGLSQRRPNPDKKKDQEGNVIWDEEAAGWGVQICEKGQSSYGTVQGTVAGTHVDRLFGSVILDPESEKFLRVWLWVRAE
eukprot:COSAG02_NODE_690_length_18450_cov_6.643017_5_plen_113_part_00